MTDEAVKTLISILRLFIPTMDMATHTTQGFVLRMFFPCHYHIYHIYHIYQSLTTRSSVPSPVYSSAY